MTTKKECMERTLFLGSHLAKHFAKRYSKLTNDEKGTIERIEKHILQYLRNGQHTEQKAIQ